MRTQGNLLFGQHNNCYYIVRIVHGSSLSSQSSPLIHGAARTRPTRTHPPRRSHAHTTALIAAGRRRLSFLCGSAPIVGCWNVNMHVKPAGTRSSRALYLSVCIAGLLPPTILISAFNETKVNNEVPFTVRAKPSVLPLIRNGWGEKGLSKRGWIPGFRNTLKRVERGVLHPTLVPCPRGVISPSLKCLRPFSFPLNILHGVECLSAGNPIQRSLLFVSPLHDRELGREKERRK